MRGSEKDLDNGGPYWPPELTQLEYKIKPVRVVIPDLVGADRKAKIVVVMQVSSKAAEGKS